MTASQLHTLPVPPMFTGSNTRSSTNPVNRNTHSGVRAKRNLFGSPLPGEIKRICDEENLKRINEFKDKYNYDILNERFVNNNNNNNNNSNNNNNNGNDDESEITTTTTTTTTPSNINNELIEKNGQDEQNSNINNLLNRPTQEKSTIIDVIPKSVISKNILLKVDNNLHDDSECDINEVDVGINVAGISNKLINNNSLLNKCEVMCNRINSTTISSSSSSLPINNAVTPAPTIKDKKRFTPYNTTKQALITDLLKVRKASPVDMTRPQKAKLHFNETDQQQQPQEQLTYQNEV